MSSRQMVEALNAIDGLSNEDFTKAFVCALLTEEFGEKVANSPEFQSVVQHLRSSAIRRRLQPTQATTSSTEYDPTSDVRLASEASSQISPRARY